jgi:geranylgeranyl transferase type-1 subunit beta
MAVDSVAESGPQLERAKHIRYWQRCLKSILPQGYTGYDSTRLTLGFFILAAIDLLSISMETPQASASTGASESPPQVQLTDSERQNLRAFVLSLQHSAGGFSGSPTHALPSHMHGGQGIEDEDARPKNTSSANIAATAFALMLLALVAKDETSARGAFTSVNRQGTLRWLKRLQRGDGSFGEVVLDDGTIGGGGDMRYSYFAAIIRWCLRDEAQPGDAGYVEDIDVKSLVAHTIRAQVRQSDRSHFYHDARRRKALTEHICFF